MKQFELIVKLYPLNDICVKSDTRDNAVYAICVTYGPGLHNTAAATTTQGLFIGFSKTVKMVLSVRNKEKDLFKLTR